MKSMFRVLCGMSVMSLFPAIAGAVGTYYNGNLYQNPQQRYSRGGYYNSYGYGSRGNVEKQLGTQKFAKKNAQPAPVKQGFILDAGLIHEMAYWDFGMNNAGSHLHYDDLAWNVLDVKGVYYFGDDTKMQVKAGFRYGKQFGDSPMIDDDVSNPYWRIEPYNVESGGVTYSEYVVSGAPAISAGTSKDGSQMGFNVAFGLTDFFAFGKVKMTPSVGYRYFKHKLQTQNNKGLSVEVLDSDSFQNCITENGEKQCSPYVGFVNSGRVEYLAALEPVTDSVGDIIGYVVKLPTNGGNPVVLDLGETYYYEQPGTSHIYETEWTGPYLALDMEYQINNDNFITGGIELGLPVYKSKGDQPYRFDWQHPTSVKDDGGFGDAYHFGANANWLTAITNSTYLSLGITYDYYRVSGATTNTYLNADAYANYLYYGIIEEEDYNYYQSKGWVIK